MLYVFVYIIKVIFLLLIIPICWFIAVLFIKKHLINITGKHIQIYLASFILFLSPIIWYTYSYYQFNNGCSNLPSVQFITSIPSQNSIFVRTAKDSVIPHRFNINAKGIGEYYIESELNTPPIRSPKQPTPAIVLDEGGVQCGFCTPGFVVTGAHLFAADPHPDEATIREAFSGNICRCTGYGALLRAFSALAEDES